MWHHMHAGSQSRNLLWKYAKLSISKVGMPTLQVSLTISQQWPSFLTACSILYQKICTPPSCHQVISLQDDLEKKIGLMLTSTLDPAPDLLSLNNYWHSWTIVSGEPDLVTSRMFGLDWDSIQMHKTANFAHTSALYLCPWASPDIQICKVSTNVPSPVCNLH